MKVLLSPDSFKGSLSAFQAAEAVAAGVRNVFLPATRVLLPVADGGEGSMQCIIDATKGTFTSVTVEDPFGRPIRARYGVTGDATQCVIDLAESSGLTLLSESEYDPLTASSFGTGQLIAHALEAGHRQFVIGLGGSATNDGGAGILQALGMQLLDNDGIELTRGGAALQKLCNFVIDNWDHRVAESTFQLIADVTNPIIGPNGATYVFGPQKGASSNDLRVLENSLTHFAHVIEQQTGISVHHTPSTGAAGGAAAAFHAFFPSVLDSGIDTILHTLRFDDHLATADLVITGEGRTDLQTLSGKAPYGIARAAQRAHVPALLVSGSISSDSKKPLSHFFADIHTIVPDHASVNESITQASQFLTAATQHALIRFSSN